MLKTRLNRQRAKVEIRGFDDIQLCVVMMEQLSFGPNPPLNLLDSLVSGNFGKFGGLNSRCILRVTGSTVEDAVDRKSQFVVS